MFQVLRISESWESVRFMRGQILLPLWIALPAVRLRLSLILTRLEAAAFLLPTQGLCPCDILGCNNLLRSVVLSLWSSRCFQCQLFKSLTISHFEQSLSAKHLGNQRSNFIIRIIQKPWPLCVYDQGRLPVVFTVMLLVATDPNQCQTCYVILKEMAVGLVHCSTKPPFRKPSTLYDCGYVIFTELGKITFSERYSHYFEALEFQQSSSLSISEFRYHYHVLMLNPFQHHPSIPQACVYSAQTACVQMWVGRHQLNRRCQKQGNSDSLLKLINRRVME